MNALTASRYRQAFDSIRERVGRIGPRHQALERFLASGLPTTREEDWKYTSLDNLERVDWHAPVQRTKDVSTEGYPGAVLKFSNGRMTDGNSQMLHARSLAAHADAAVVTRYQGQLIGTLSSGAALAEINSALWQDGLLLHVPAGWKGSPWFAVHGASEADAMLHVRNLIVLEAGAEAHPLIVWKIVAAVKARQVYAGWHKPPRFERNLIVIGGGSARRSSPGGGGKA